VHSGSLDYIGSDVSYHVGWTVDYGVADGINRFNSTYMTNDESSLNIPRYTTSTRAMRVELQPQEGGKAQS
jgi:hypothetical protein